MYEPKIHIDASNDSETPGAGRKEDASGTTFTPDGNAFHDVNDRSDWLG